MTIIGLDDTDSRDRGMCTTYLATRIAERVEAIGGTVRRRLLIRLNPAVEHKTRGNAALAIHTDLDVDRAFSIAREQLCSLAETDDERTAPGLVVAPISGTSEPSPASTGSSTAIPQSVATFARDAVREFHELDDTLALLERLEWPHRGWGGGAGPDGTTGVGDGAAGRGRIGALAAIGAWRAFEEWTYEGIAYREFERCGTPRQVDVDSVFAAADAGYPTVWDTVDRAAGEAVCVPNAPGPILYGIRGDDPEAVRAVMADIDAELVERSALFRTNQGTDAHVRDAAETAPDELQVGRSYRLSGTVASVPETRRGGHVFVDLAVDGDRSVETAAPIVRCAAFEPTKRFRDRVRSLRPGDRVTACGELGEPRTDGNSGESSEATATAPIGTLKLEKFAVRSLTRTRRVTPTCPDCERTMESAGREQGYRCRDCGTAAPEKERQSIDRDLDRGWYEVPPLARRHIAKPLIRGGFDAPVHPER